MKTSNFGLLKTTILLSFMFLIQGCEQQMLQEALKAQNQSLSQVPAGHEASTLWGANGENWDPAGRLPDFSMAGYHYGEASLPGGSGRTVKNVKTHFGARGNGSADDTAAIKNAINSLTSNQILFFPEGTYKLTEDLEIRKGDIILRGAGKGKTILYFEKSLRDLCEPNCPAEGSRSYFSANGGLISVWGSVTSSNTLITRVSSEAIRGDSSINVANANSMNVGDLIVVGLHEPAEDEPGAGTLAEHLNEGLGVIGSNAYEHSRPRRLVSFNARIKAINGSRITLNRTLPTDIDLRWHPEVHRFAPTVKEFGLESMTLKYPDRPWPGHHQGDEYNSLALYGIANSWIKDVEIRNADNGIFVEGSSLCVIKNVNFTNYSARGNLAGGYAGHYGIMLGGGAYENVVTGFDYQSRYYHDLSVTSAASLNVFENGSGYDINMDHHRSWPHHNLFTNIDLGLAGRTDGNNGVFNSGGSSRFVYGTHTAGYETFWNLRSQNRFDLPRAYDHNTFGPLVNFVGLNNNPGYDDRGLDWFVEQIQPDKLHPQNLYRAQLARRLANGDQVDPGGNDDNNDDDNTGGEIRVIEYKALPVTVKYGANGQWATKVVNAGESLSCSNTTFGDPIPGVYKSCYDSRTNRKLAGERGTVRIPEAASKEFATGQSVNCSNSIFGDAAPGFYKGCFDQASSNKLADEGQNFSVPQDGGSQGQSAVEYKALPVTVKYGANGHWATKTLNAGESLSCSNSTFGDPIPGVVKSCYDSRTNRKLASERGSVQIPAGSTKEFDSGQRVNCANSVFGDSAPGFYKGCFNQATNTKLANEGQSFSAP